LIDAVATHELRLAGAGAWQLHPLETPPLVLTPHGNSSTGVSV
jgi:hypothetical protein